MLSFNALVICGSRCDTQLPTTTKHTSDVGLQGAVPHASVNVKLRLEEEGNSALMFPMWHPDITEQRDEMHYGPNKHSMKRNDLIHVFEESFKLLMILPLITDISNQLQIVSRWFNLVLCCSGAILRCVVLITELHGLKNRGGLLSLLQPNPSDSVEPRSEHTGHFYSPDL